jgi:hypothetical protein
MVDPGAALEMLLIPGGMLESEGAEVVSTELCVDEVDQNGVPLKAWPDFSDLFPMCTCNETACERCASGQLPPRPAAVLWSMANLLADQAYEDVLEHGDDPLDDSDGPWLVFDGFPRITWRQNAVWRRQAARAFDDLAADLEAGDWPQPCCPAEEMALHMMIDTARAAAADGWSGLEDTFADLPEYDDDLDWDLLIDMMFQDTDMLALFNAALDGIEDPSADQNRYLRMGDYTPAAWFTTFRNMEARDPRRPFRR